MTRLEELTRQYWAVERAEERRAREREAKGIVPLYDEREMAIEEAFSDRMLEELTRSKVPRREYEKIKNAALRYAETPEGVAFGDAVMEGKPATMTAKKKPAAKKTPAKKAAKKRVAKRVVAKKKAAKKAPARKAAKKAPARKAAKKRVAKRVVAKKAAKKAPARKAARKAAPLPAKYAKFVASL